jgi:hypothetical protein
MSTSSATDNSSLERSRTEVGGHAFLERHGVESSSDSRVDLPSRRGVILRRLLGHAVQLRDLYKSARTLRGDCASNALLPILNEHYHGQLRLVDVLIDRTRAICGDQIFAGDLFSRFKAPVSACGRSDLRLLLLALLEAHDSIIAAAQPGGGGGDESIAGSPWFKDFAVGQVILTNQLQLHAIEDLLATGAREPTVSARISMMKD